MNGSAAAPAAGIKLASPTVATIASVKLSGRKVEKERSNAIPQSPGRSKLDRNGANPPSRVNPVRHGSRLSRPWSPATGSGGLEALHFGEAGFGQPYHLEFDRQPSLIRGISQRRLSSAALPIFPARKSALT